MLLPLPEPGLLGLDLLGKALAQSFLFFLELRIIKFLNLGLAEFAGLHLLLTVVLVVKFLGRVDKIEHVGTDEERTELFEVAVLLIVNLNDTPWIRTPANLAAIGCIDKVIRTDYSEWDFALEGSPYEH